MGTNRGMVRRTMSIQSKNISRKIMMNCMPKMIPHSPKGRAITAFLTNWSPPFGPSIFYLKSGVRDEIPVGTMYGLTCLICGCLV